MESLFSIVVSLELQLNSQKDSAANVNSYYTEHLREPACRSFYYRT